MKLSQFEINVLDALIKDDPEERILRKQLNGASAVNREYTGVGLFTTIQVGDKSETLSKSNRYIEETPKTHLEHPNLKAGAGSLLWFKDGYISTLECYTYDDNWPKDESLFKIIV